MDPELRAERGEDEVRERVVLDAHLREQQRHVRTPRLVRAACVARLRAPGLRRVEPVAMVLEQLDARIAERDPPLARRRARAERRRAVEDRVLQHALVLVDQRLREA